MKISLFVCANESLMTFWTDVQKRYFSSVLSQCYFKKILDECAEAGPS
jgi:hypothetical protein